MNHTGDFFLPIELMMHADRKSRNSEIKIDKKLCVSCFLCIAVCLTNKIKLPSEKKGVPEIDPDAYCYGCEDCVIICESNAISLSYGAKKERKERKKKQIND